MRDTKITQNLYQKALFFTLLFYPQINFAVSFSIESNEVINSQQSLLDNESGFIETTGQLTTNNTAIIASGNLVHIINNGDIRTTDASAYGISSLGTNLSLTNNGSITTLGNLSDGIFSLGDNANIVNNGTITTLGSSASGIFSNGNNAHIVNTGNIYSSGFAIFTNASNAAVINSGTISTTNGSAFGLFSQGSNVSLTNTGTITTTGNDAFGIFSTSNDAYIINTGSIQTSGNNAFAIFSVGANALIDNAGFISTVGSTAAIFAVGNSVTLNLLPGSQIIGRIDLGDDGGDNDTVNIYDIGSANLTFENVENINLFGTGLVSGNNVISVDPTGESTRGVALSSMTSSIHSVIGQRMARTAPLKSVQLASLELSPGMYFEEHKPVAWTQFFGGRFDRDAEGSAMAYDHNHVGVNFGYEWDISGHRAGLMGGIVRSTTETQTASFETEADNYYVGAYANRKTHGLNITGSLIAGYGDHDNDRLVVDNLNGVETAKSDFNSWFISPGLTIGSAFTVNERIELRPSVSMNYSIAWLDDYRESGTTNSNLTVDDRKAKAFNGRAQLAAAYQLSDTSEFELRAGVNSRHTNDDDTKVGIAGSQFRFANAGDESVTGGFAGAALRVMNDNNFTLIADVEFGGNSDEDYAAGSLTLQYAF